MCDREIDAKHPYAYENEHGRKFHSLGDSTNDQRRRDNREHQLIHREDILRSPIGIVRVRPRIEAVAVFVSAPRGELFIYASRSATRCFSAGEAESGGVCACAEQSNAMVPTSNRSRILTRSLL